LSPASFFRPDKWPRTPQQFFQAAAAIPLTPAEWLDAAQDMRRSPSRMFLDMVENVARSVAGRELEIRSGDSDVTLVLDDVQFNHEPPVVPWIPGTELEVVDEIDIDVHGVRWEAGQIDRLRIRVRNVRLEPGVVATVYARPVELVGEVGQSTLDAWLVSTGPGADVEITLDGEGTATAVPTQWKRWGVRAQVAPVLEGDQVHIDVLRIWVGPFSFRRLRWVPERHTIELPHFDRELTIIGLTVSPGLLQVRGHIPEWREKVHIDQVIRAAGVVGNHVIFDRDPA